ncbi:hypothetical protein EUTSA_v10026711mg [Eutrema salsugineum]|uniref:Uncharacterized protein n=1 Tax=Eutrema salsugineum TaxID=72664 RepID=V4MBV9_EUTSA|nr:hypothetical protein EUTSA_v10026711mg [Eutrema salsugineum]
MWLISVIGLLKQSNKSNTLQSLSICIDIGQISNTSFRSLEKLQDVAASVNLPTKKRRKRGRRSETSTSVYSFMEKNQRE